MAILATDSHVDAWPTLPAPKGVLALSGQQGRSAEPRPCSFDSPLFRFLGAFAPSETTPSAPIFGAPFVVSVP